jgi:hypothetical protein
LHPQLQCVCRILLLHLLLLLCLGRLPRLASSRPVLQAARLCFCIVLITVFKPENDWRVIIVWQVRHISACCKAAPVVGSHACCAGSSAGSSNNVASQKWQ